MSHRRALTRLLTDERGEFNPASLTFGVTALVGVIASLTITGTVGRVLRNGALPFTLALAFVLLGTFLLGLSALPATEGRWDTVCGIGGLAAAIVGIGIGAYAATQSAGASERPRVEATMIDDGLTLKATVKIGNLSSTKRVTVLVDGLRENGETFSAYTLEQFHVGPDEEGKVEAPISVRIPSGRFDAVGIRAWTLDGDAGAVPPCVTPVPELSIPAAPASRATATPTSTPTPCPSPSATPSATPSNDHDHSCARYARQVSAPGQQGAVETIGTGCVVLPLPPIPLGPEVALTWAGKANETTRVLVTIKADNVPVRLHHNERECGVAIVTDPKSPPPDCEPTRVAVQVKARRRGWTAVLYRALLRPDAKGHLDAKVALPVNGSFQRICAQARFATQWYDFAAACRVTAADSPSWAYAELRSPRLRTPKS